MKKFILAAVLVALPYNVTMAFEATPSVGVGMLMQSGHDSKMGYDIGMGISIAEAGRGWAIVNVTSAFHSAWSEGEQLEVVRNMTVTKKSLWSKMADKTMVGDIHIGMGTGVWNFLNSEGENEVTPAYEFQVGGFYEGITFDVGVNAIQKIGADMYYVYTNFGFNF